MNGRKAFWKSKGFLGPLAALVAILVQENGGPEIDQDQLVQTILNGIEYIGIGMGIYGRATANKKLGVKDS